METLTTISDGQWKQQLAFAGYKHRGGQNYHCGDFELEIVDEWGTFSIRPENLPIAAGSFLEMKGLWKRLVTGEHRLVADIPLQALFAAGDAEEADVEDKPLAKTIAWVQNTFQGEFDKHWQPPSRDEIESWLDSQKFTFIAGKYVRQGKLTCETGRLAVRVPLIPAIPSELSAERKRWLKSIVAETQDRFRMVRIGFCGAADQRKIEAEFDLSGAPYEALQPLFTSGMAALRSAVQWSVQSLGFLADPNSDAHVLQARKETHVYSS